MKFFSVTRTCICHVIAREWLPEMAADRGTGPFLHITQRCRGGTWSHSHGMSSKETKPCIGLKGTALQGGQPAFYKDDGGQPGSIAPHSLTPYFNILFRPALLCLMCLGGHTPYLGDHRRWKTLTGEQSVVTLHIAKGIRKPEPLPHLSPFNTGLQSCIVH